MAAGQRDAKLSPPPSLPAIGYCSSATSVDEKPAPGTLKTVTVLGTSSTAAKVNARWEGRTVMPKAPPWLASMLDSTTNLPLFVKFDDPARVSGVWVFRVAVGCDQIAVRRQDQPQGTAQMRVLKDKLAFVDRRRPRPSGGNREDRVVHGGSDVESVGPLVEGEACRPENERDRVALMGIPLCDFVLTLYGYVRVNNAQIDPGDRSRHDV